MPLQQTTTGLLIQDIAEIKSEREASYRLLFGADVPLGPSSILGKIIGVDSDREALIQAQMQFIQAGFSRSVSYTSSPYSWPFGSSVLTTLDLPSGSTPGETSCG